MASLRERGVDVRVTDLASVTHAELVDELRGVSAVVSAIYPTELHLQKPLAKAAKEAGVSRFIPCDWATACVRGVLELHDLVSTLNSSLTLGRIT